jgi:hypothetical protein
MSRTEEFEKFLNAENEQERYSALEHFIRMKDSSWHKDLRLWQVLSLLPTKVERVRLAHALRLGDRPSSNWATISFLFHDQEQDVVGNAINAMTFSGNRSLGHRTLNFFESSERPQRVLYCLARYAEETVDRRFSKYLAPHLASDLSDAFLARSFNALFRLGLKDPIALNVARELVGSHIDATNMDRKAAVSAVLYLCFAGSREEIENLRNICRKVSIPELKRLLNWGFSHINISGADNFSSLDACRFFERALLEEEPNFAGYGCFDDKNLHEGFAQFLDKQPLEAVGDVSRIALILGETNCIDILATHQKFGLNKILAEKNTQAMQHWKKYLPLESKPFLESIKDPTHFHLWHAPDPEMLFIVLHTDDFLKNGKKEGWQKLFEKLAVKEKDLAVDLLSTQFLAYERAFQKEAPSEEFSGQFEALLDENLTLLLRTEANNLPREEILNRIFGTCVGGNLPASLYTSILKKALFDEKSWAFNGIALCAPRMDAATLKVIILSELQNLRKDIQDPTLNAKDYVIKVISRLQAILVGALRFQIVVSTEVLGAIEELSLMVQAVLNAVEDSGHGKVQESEEDKDDFDGADWAGHISVDKPVLRWNAVLQICLNASLTLEDKKKYEQVLLEGMRIAPHAEKRWIIRSLVKIGTDDAVKAILYQAFQHVDTEFVSHTIRELLPSRHPRAQQALIRCVGRTTVPDDLKLMILEEISLDSPTEILQELRTLEILRLPQHIDDAIKDAVGRVASLIDLEHSKPNGEEFEKFLASDVDVIIKKQIPDVDFLSVDTRSALRTAEMILIQSREWGAEAVDLSPIVNMHCKAVELTMREVFEPHTDSIIRKGHLSRKLDILGYARPIPEKMQIFEDYLATLPIIKTIPYFSKFKLRKMLRAICLYRPGKRFTLDGPKAFALLFLTTSRKTCQFGLENILPLGFTSDHELFEFIKLVHSLQDSRNRAVHEGLTWEAKDEIETMRSQAYKIIESCIRIGKHLQKNSHSNSGSTPNTAFELGA